jgi:SAM-dependent methyltransferase
MIDLLRVKGEVKAPPGGGEYVDVLGDHDPIGPHRGQQVFRRKAVTVIYERLWRPLVSLYFLGFSGPRAEEEGRLTLEMLGLSSRDRVIDVGCGPGNYTRRLAEVASEGLVVGTDASEAMVAAGARRSPENNVAYLRADACALPFADGSFDAACCVGVVHLIEKPMAALDEMVRLLAPDGRLVIAATCARPDRPRSQRAGLTIFARDELVDALRERGMVDVRQRVIGRGQFVSARRPKED